MNTEQNDNEIEPLRESTRVLVTGGGGFLGQYIVEQLLERGCDVSIFSRGEYPELTAQGVNVIRGDIRDVEDVQNACEKQEVVFHVAALPGVWGSWKTYYDINTKGTQNVIEASKKHGVKKLIYTSSPSVIFDGQPHLDANESLPYPEKYLTHYPHSKALGEKAVLGAGKNGELLTCSLRPHLIWGPRDNHLIPRLLEKAKSGRLRKVGDGENLISMSYVENVATAHLQAADALTKNSPVNGEAYFINEIEPVNLWKWINEILALANVSQIEKSISKSAAYRVGAVLEGIYTCLPFIKSEPPMTRFVALQLSESHTYSTAKAQRDFGYSPKISFEEGIKRLANSFQ